MKLDHVDNYKFKDSSFYLVGRFHPSLFFGDHEFAFANHKKGEKSTPHYHTSSTEYNIIVNGKLMVSGKELNSGDIFIYAPNEIAEVEFLEDTLLIIIRDRSFNGGDKILV